ncbi:MAG TPA: polysaccharide deacetylase family protein [Bryobacteraceae bacterium]|nr:polysaccharide deacetylase family protein [Bryobacteraceae bacterium]
MRIALALLLLPLATTGANRKVAITIDDLPPGGDGADRSFAGVRSMTERLLAPLREQKIPVTGFVHPGRTELSAPDLRRILNLWLDAGADLGNHTMVATLSHADLNRTAVAEYEQDILKADAALLPVVEARGKRLEFFRYPMLHAGPTVESKRTIAEFLGAHGYRNAPVTFDNSDYMFAAAYNRPELRARVIREYVPYLESVVAFFEGRSVEVAGREFPQILLLHANELNSWMMPEILGMFRGRGYRFVALAEALRDPAYRMRDSYVGPGGFSWIHRWSMTKGMPNRGEPDEPEWVRRAFAEARGMGKRVTSNGVIASSNKTQAFPKVSFSLCGL